MGLISLHKVAISLMGLQLRNTFVWLCLKEVLQKEGIVWKEIEQMFPNLITLKKQIAGRLSGGERIILSIACVLASDANFLVLDEPTAGLAPETCKVIGDFLLRMKNDRHKTIMLLEHNYDFAFGIADSVVTLKEGKLSEKYFSKDFKKPNFVDEKLYKTITS
jgi:ABC-type branched-subunit amino acid transport system ATPase component